MRCRKNDMLKMYFILWTAVFAAIIDIVNENIDKKIFRLDGALLFLLFVVLLVKRVSAEMIFRIYIMLVLFLFTAISTLFLTNPVSKWSILSTTVVPLFMNSGLSPEFAQLITRFAECCTMGLTPLLAYFVIYLFTIIFTNAIFFCFNHYSHQIFCTRFPK